MGHTFSLESLAIEQAEEVERALWAAVRALEESAAITRRVGATAPRSLQQRLDEKQRAHAQQADVIRRILLNGRGTSVTSRAEPAGEGAAAR